jgi:hypothetical protein
MNKIKLLIYNPKHHKNNNNIINLETHYSLIMVKLNLIQMN